VSGTASVEAIPQLDTFVFAGSPGCDVCGMLRANRVWIVLPPLTRAHEFAVSVSDGTDRSFLIHAGADARAMSITLPPLPTGLEYVDGHVTIF
jgi:hypothetical protein